MEYEKRDRYQRILGKVLVSGPDMNLEQVKAGLVWHCKKYQDDQTTANRVKYSDAEREASMAKRGLWQDANPMPPWEYRKGESKHKKAMEPFIIGLESTGNPY